MPPRPTVAFVDDETWLSFVDLAAGLRSRGVRVVRGTARMPTFEGRLVQRLEGLAFGRTRVGAVDRHTGSIDLVALDAVLSDDVIDVVVQDPLVPELLGPGPLPPRRLGHWLMTDAPASRRQAILGNLYRRLRAILGNPAALTGLVIVLVLIHYE